MPAARRRDSTGPAAPMTPFIVAGGLAVAAACTVYGYPGAVALYVALVVAAFLHPAPTHTGRKDASGFVRPSTAAEQRKQAAFERQRELRRVGVVPGPGWLPKSHLVIVGGAAAALVASAAPVLTSWWALANAAAAYLCVVVPAAARREATGSPGVLLSTWREPARAALVACGLVGLLVCAVVGLGTRRLLTLQAMPPRPWWVLAWMLAGAVGGAAVPWARTSLEHWRDILAARAEWEPRWLGIKVDPEPLLVETAAVGPARVDTFQANAATGGAARIVKDTDKVATLLGSLVRTAVLTCPVEHDGQEVPGTVDATKVAVCSWPVEQWPADGVGTDLDSDALTMLARIQWQPRWALLKEDPAPVLLQASIVGGCRVDVFTTGSKGAMFYLPLVAKLAPTFEPGTRVVILPVGMDGQPSTVQMSVVAIPEGAGADVFDADADPDALRLALNVALVGSAVDAALPPPLVAEIERITDEASAPVWQVRCVFPFGGSLEDVRAVTLGTLRARLDSPALADTYLRGPIGDDPSLFVGALGVPDVQYTVKLAGRDAADRMERVADQDDFHRIMSEVAKAGANVPVLQTDTITRDTLANGTELTRRGHAVWGGLNAAEYNTESHRKKFASAVPGMTFAAITAFYGGRVDGTRHDTIFATIVGKGPIPENLSVLAPGPAEPVRPAGRRVGSGRPSTGLATTWLIQVMLDRAFDAVRLPRVQLRSAPRALTRPGGRQHIWELKVRLYDGLTVGTLRTSSERLRQALRVPWMRVVFTSDGDAIIYAGADPASLVALTDGSPGLADPERDQPLLGGLNWEFGFFTAKVTGHGDRLPVIEKVAPMAGNDLVVETTLGLPEGLERADLVAATEKLKTATGFGWIEFRPSTDPRVVVALSASTDPMPARVPYLTDRAKASTAIPFATFVDGTDCIFDWFSSAHLLVLGGQGSGKSATMQVLATGALLRDAEFVVIDPMKGAADFKFLEPYATAFVADDFHEAAAALRAVYAEVERRKRLNSQHGVSLYTELPDPPPRIVVIIDEFTSLILTEAVQTQAFDDPEMEADRQAVIAKNNARKVIGQFTGKLAREARSAGVTLWLGSQKLSADTLKQIPGGGDLKDNMARLLLGKTSYGMRQSGLMLPEEVADLGSVVPRGRALFETAEMNGTPIQVWWSPSSELSDVVSEHCAPLPADRRYDLTAFDKTRPASTGPAVEEVELESLGDDIVVDAGELDLTDVEMDFDFDDDPAEPSADDPDDQPGDVTVFPAPEPVPQPEPDVEAPIFDWDAADSEPEPQLDPAPTPEPAPSPVRVSDGATVGAWSFPADEF